MSAARCAAIAMLCCAAGAGIPLRAQAQAAPQANSIAASEPPPALSPNELAALGFGSSSTDASDAMHVAIHGFIDFSFGSVIGSSVWRSALEPNSSFFIGNFNLYLSANLTDSIRTFAEVRLTYLPHGSTDRQTFDGTYISTLAYDYNDFQRELHWGALEIERVYIEWAMLPFLSLRAGQYLTPYGIWNVDHGSPTIIPVARPFVIGQGLFPERQTGLELFGRTRLSANHSLGYHLTLSNGLGPVSEYRDLDANKAIGGRLFWVYEGLGQLQVGVSGFYGRDTAARQIVVFGNGGPMDFKNQVDTQSDVLALAADVRFTVSGFLAQAELITQQRAYTAHGRLGAPNPLTGGRYLAPADAFNLGGYLLAGHRFRWLGVMPYAQLGWVDFVDSYFSVTNSWGVGFGLNIRPYDNIVLKLEYFHSTWLHKYVFTDDPTQLLNAQLAWAF